LVSALELLGPGGPLQRSLDGYEERQGQLEMARAVERTLREGRVLVCEAGTGTGKTLAYLLPAILSGKKVIISTATRALQEQIYGKDLPLIAKTLGLSPRAALMKGIGNYVCRRRYQEFRRSEEAGRPEYARSLDLVESWIAETETGDLAELAGLREDDPLRAEIASSSETRLGLSCPHYESCFVTNMKREAETAEIVVVNHHLFFADLALRGPHPGRVLPDYDAVIFDEAHQLEDVATLFFGLRVSDRRIERLLKDAERALRASGEAGALFGGGERLIQAVRDATRLLFRELSRQNGGSEGRVTLERDVWAGPAQERWFELDGALDGLAALAATTRARLEGPTGRGSAFEGFEVTERRAELLREQLAAIVEGGAGRVTWLDLGPKGAALSSSPVDLSHALRERIFESVPAVVLTSATLATVTRKGDEADASGAFGYLRSRLGIADSGVVVDELVVSSRRRICRRRTRASLRAQPPIASPSSAASRRAAASCSRRACARCARSTRSCASACRARACSCKARARKRH
jgi:ATP-dependent DNA helicase DinG